MEDSEKHLGKHDSYTHSSSPDIPEYGEAADHTAPWTTRIIDSFRRDPNAHATPKGSIGADGRVFDVEGAAQATANSPLQRSLKGRHLQMIAIGGSIGTGLFVGSGQVISLAGPLSAFISYAVTGFNLYCVINSLGEMAAWLPIPGAVPVFGARFVDPALGFTLGWVS